MKYLNILAKKTYTDSDGNGKVSWFKAGHIKETVSGARYLILYSQPDTTFQIFESADIDKEEE
tara:strand:+ start:423 stop:611 length:189 start_codon:yes stop_codon:yes gene_type:complete